MGIEAFYEHLGLPKACYLGKRIFKKQFHDNAKLTAMDKKALSEDVDTIEWRYTLKPSTIHIPKFGDEKRDYSEIALIHIRLKERKRHHLITQLIQRSIPYPLILVLEHAESILLEAADKRISQTDREKMVVESFFDTGWIPLVQASEVQQAFLNDFCVSRFSFANFFAFYQDIVQRLVALNCAERTGRYNLPTTDGETASEAPAMRRLEQLRALQELERKQASLRSALKNEAQFNQRVDLNMRIKKLSEEMSALQAQL